MFVIIIIVKGDATGGSGHVLHFQSKEPIMKAVVSLECQRKNLLHGSRTLKKIQVSTGANGRYHFGSLKIFFCDRIEIRANKEGMYDDSYDYIRSSRSSIEQVPIAIYMAPIALKNIRELERIYRIFSGLNGLTPQTDLSKLKMKHYSNDEISLNTLGFIPSINLSLYHDAYGAFLRSRNHMKTEKEILFVKDRYCYWMNKLHKRLTRQERSHLPRMTVHPYVYEEVDHRIVMETCKNS